MTGEMFGPYRLEELIGRGGMGEVYRAFDTTKARLVAVKRLPVSLSADASFQARFRREAEVTARLTEPHIIPIHDYGDIDGHLFLDMRLVTGTDLATVVAEQAALPPRRAAAIIVQIAAALDAAHTAGLVHRDIKPSNVLLTGEPDPAGSGEFAYLIDFGIASSLRDTALTQTGSIVGSAAYMAPERFTDHHGGDHRVDIYALGCVLYELLAGQVPFPASDMASYMGAHLHTPPPALERLPAEMTGPFNAVIARALSKDPALRYQTAGELATDAHTAAYGTTSPNPETLVSPTLIEHATRTPDQVTDPTHASTPPTTRPPQQTQHPDPAPAATLRLDATSTDGGEESVAPQGGGGVAQLATAPPPQSVQLKRRKLPLTEAGVVGRPKTLRSGLALIGLGLVGVAVIYAGALLYPGVGALQSHHSQQAPAGGAAPSPPNGVAGPPSPKGVLTSSDVSISVEIPAGWHQIPNADNPKMPQMVYPMYCPEVSAALHCAGGITRISTSVNPGEGTVGEFAADVKKGFGSSAHIVGTISEGNAMVGGRAGYRFRIIWTPTDNNDRRTTEFAIVPTGPPPSLQGASGRTFSLVVVVLGSAPDAPSIASIDEIINSVVVRNR
ncbi:protein kinase domain-containing protein [Pseudonocardia sp. Cha107L01]|uniref:protein kinase domain-containing protein n=1 Tax=Pseudonocardia sp. Cha107L01 TaxID=3457576 RepID=UPI00403EA6F2